MSKIKDLTNKRFGKLIVREFVAVIDHKARWLCDCDCGGNVTTYGISLISGNTTSCGCRVKEQCGNLNRLRPYEAIYRRLNLLAKHPVELTYAEFLEFTKINECHYCGDRIMWTVFNSENTGAGYHLDRKDSKLPYTADNCVVCCTRCNFSKSNRFSYDEWVKIGNLIRTWTK